MPFRLIVWPIFLGSSNFTIFFSFRNFHSFRKFRSIQLCPSDLFDPFFWGQPILICFAVFIIFAVSGYALQTCCLTHFSGVDDIYYFRSFRYFRNFCSFRNFHSIRLCPSDLMFDPFFWGRQILLFFKVFVVFAVFEVFVIFAVSGCSL